MSLSAVFPNKKGYSFIRQNYFISFYVFRAAVDFIISILGPELNASEKSKLTLVIPSPGNYTLRSF